MTNFMNLMKPNGDKILINLDNLLFAEDFIDETKYGDRKVTRLVFNNENCLIIDGTNPHELHQKIKDLNN